MLSAPCHGWTEITVGDFVGRGSHIQDVPVLLLEAFLRSLRWNIPAEVAIDEEGSTFELHSLDTTVISVRRDSNATYCFNLDAHTLAAELIADLRRDWQGWLLWRGSDSKTSLERRAAHLNRLIDELEKHLLQEVFQMNKIIPLWPTEAPFTAESPEQAQPSITDYKVEGSRGAGVVCPGGAYAMKADHEGGPIAEMLNEAGVSAYVLDYRVAPCHHLAPLTDALRAIRVVRSMGYEKVGILGFSPAAT